MENVCVGICTYNRYKSLERLLEKLRFQITYNLFTYSVLVVDNDIHFSAQNILKKFSVTNFNLSYYNEKEKNIAKARNKVLELANGNFLALIDDDEYPDDLWLYNHYIACKRFDADGTLGPVISRLPETSPKWIRESDVCNRKSLKTGLTIKPYQARTGNCFFKNEIGCKFDEEFGLTGGEDIDFFYRLINIMNRKVVWCQEAIVYEPVTEDRLNRIFYIQRAIKRGQNSHRFLEKNRSKYYALSMVVVSLFKSLVILIISPFILFSKEKIRMRFVESFFHHLGRMLTVFKNK